MATINTKYGRTPIRTRDELIECIAQVGFLPLLESGIAGYSADALVDADCRYTMLPDGGWEWPLWEWKGAVINEGDCVYGKFFDGKAGFVARQWWPDFVNWRRSLYPAPEPGTVEEAIVTTLRDHGSTITRDLRRLCGFNGPKMRGRFDAYVTRLQRGCHIVTEDFVYARDKHGRPYGWGLALLSTPEQLLGADACRCDRAPQLSRDRMAAHLAAILPQATARQLSRLLD